MKFPASVGKTTRLTVAVIEVVTCEFLLELRIVAVRPSQAFIKAFCYHEYLDQLFFSLIIFNETLIELHIRGISGIAASLVYFGISLLATDFHRSLAFSSGKSFSPENSFWTPQDKSERTDIARNHDEDDESTRHRRLASNEFLYWKKDYIHSFLGDIMRQEWRVASIDKVFDSIFVFKH